MTGTARLKAREVTEDRRRESEAKPVAAIATLLAAARAANREPEDSSAVPTSGIGAP